MLCNIIIIKKKKGAVHRTEIERPFLAAKGFNINLVRFLLHIMLSLVMCTSALLGARFPKCTDVPLNLFCKYEISCTKNYDL